MQIPMLARGKSVKTELDEDILNKYGTSARVISFFLFR